MYLKKKISYQYASYTQTYTHTHTTHTLTKKHNVFCINIFEF